MELFETIPAEGVFARKTELTPGVHSGNEGAVVNVFDQVRYQPLRGFGAAITESAAYEYSLMSNAQKREFLERHFGTDGLQYRIVRIPMASCDFALDLYTHVAEGDPTLESFSIERDLRYLLPMLKDVVAFCKEKPFFFISPWSPPAYMKDNDNRIRGGRLKKEYYGLWAKYFVKFIEAYANEGVKIDALTVQNEPKARQPWESCNYASWEEREFIDEHLIPALDQAGLGHVQVILWDHNKERVYDRAKKVLDELKHKDRVLAVGFHWYSGDHFDALTLVHDELKKELLCTEFCGGIREDPHALAERYAREISEDLNHFANGICDWNILLSATGGPYHNRTAASVSVPGQIFESKDGGCYAPVLYDKDAKEVNYTPIYQYIWHYAHFVAPGAHRVAASTYSRFLFPCAYADPSGKTYLTLLNISNHDLPANLRRDGEVTSITVKAHSVATVCF